MQDSKKAEQRRISLEQQKWKKTAKVTAKKKRSSDNVCFLVSHEKKGKENAAACARVRRVLRYVTKRTKEQEREKREKLKKKKRALYL